MSVYFSVSRTDGHKSRTGQRNDHPQLQVRRSVIRLCKDYFCILVDFAPSQVYDFKSDDFIFLCCLIFLDLFLPLKH